MSRDLVKTVVGLVLIGLIMVATFLYGNKQRQDQLRSDQEAKQAQTRSSSTPQISSPASTSTDQAPSGGTAAVVKPTVNDLQSGANATSGLPEGFAQSASQTPVTPERTTIPQTGPAGMLLMALPLSLIAALSTVLRGSKSRLRAAVLHY
jgi:hypothetical protein